MRKVLITGTAGFIGFHLAKLLLEQGFRVQGYDGMSDYYDVRLKQLAAPACPCQWCAAALIRSGPRSGRRDMVGAT